MAIQRKNGRIVYSTTINKELVAKLRKLTSILSLEQGKVVNSNELMEEGILLLLDKYDANIERWDDIYG